MALLLSISLFLAAASALAQAPVAPQTNSSSAEKNGVVEGSVVSLTDEPLRRATLRLLGAPGPTSTNAPPQTNNYSVSSDATGHFRFEVIEPGRYTLLAERTGYVRQYYGARAPGRGGLMLTVAEGSHLTGLTIAMTPQGIIAGTVEDEDGEPLSGVQVMVYRMGYQNGEKQFIPANSASVNPDGTFMVGNLAPGRYYMSASDTRPMMMGGVAERSGSRAPETGYLTTYYPGTAERSAATAVDLAAGMHLRGFEIRLIRARVYKIRGTVTGLSNETGTYLTLMRTDGSGIFNMQSARPIMLQRDGSFMFSGVAPGSYVIRSNRNGPVNAGQTPVVAYSPLTISDQDLDGIAVLLSSGIDLTGIISVEGAQSSTPQTTMEHQQPKPNLRIGLQIADGTFGSPGVQAKDDGTFDAHGLIPGKYRVSIFGQPQGSYVKHVQFGGVDITHDNLDLTSGSGGALSILLSPKAASVSGLVRDENGNAVSNIPVTLWSPGRPANGLYDAPRSTSTDASGAFQFANLAPGEYRAAAWEDIEPGLVQNPDFRERFESTAIKATLTESSNTTVEMKVIPRDTILAEIGKLP
jgi:protocatechuate 3,4-dioxygenase beta subunit